jgi:integrase
MGGYVMATIRLRYVHRYVDRHGTVRHYYRRHGKSTPLPGEPGTSEFIEAYSALLEGRETPRHKPAVPVIKGSFRELATVYYGSPHYRSLSPTSRTNYRRIIDRFVAEHGHRQVGGMRREHVVKIIGGMADRPGAGITLLKRMRTLIRFALDLGWIEADPTHKVRSYRSREIHTWSEEELARFEACWEPGTRERLAYGLLLYTGQRGSDVHRMGWPDIAGDTIRVVQEKTKEKLTIALHPELQKLLAVAPRKHVAILTTAYGRPFSLKGFGNFISSAITAAGLPTKCKAHGLRKAAARRLADVGCTANEIAAVTGHKTLAEVERYTRAADQARLHRRAIERQAGNMNVARLKEVGDKGAL